MASKGAGVKPLYLPVASDNPVSNEHMRNPPPTPTPHTHTHTHTSTPPPPHTHTHTHTHTHHPHILLPNPLLCESEKNPVCFLHYWIHKCWHSTVTLNLYYPLGQDYKSIFMSVGDSRERKEDSRYGICIHVQDENINHFHIMIS